MHEAFIKDIVHECYWTHDINCAGTALTILSGLHSLPLDKQVMSAAIGMHGAGGFRAQCGLVEGSLMFLGVLGASRGKSPKAIADDCFRFATEFSERFGSLSCEILRPGGFSADDAPHLCEKMTVDAIAFAHHFIDRPATSQAR